MNYSQLINEFNGIACVVSLRKNASAPENFITITAANEKYLTSVGKTHEDFVPNKPYTEYVNTDPNFEALVVGCIQNKKIMHQYVNAELYNAWIDIYMIPMEKDEEGNEYCLFSYEMTMKADSDKLVDISAQTASLVLKTCIKLRETNDFKSAMDSIVDDIRNQCEANGCSMLLTDFEERKVDILGISNNDDFAPLDDEVFFKPEFFEIVETWPDIIAGSNCYIIKDEHDLEDVEKKSPKWYASLIYSGVKNLVLFPMRLDGKTLGFIFVINFNTDKINFIREIMELNAFILSAEVGNFLMREKLEAMSKTDILTNVLNRNAMKDKIAELESGDKNLISKYGVIFIDVNGLKIANDTLGHSHGDDILKSVAHRLKKVFSKNEIYRIGGDEFLIMTVCKSKESFEESVKKLRALSDIENEPSFAMGYHYDETQTDIRKALKTADGNMYKDKAEYYKTHPKLDRRNR